MLCIDLGWTRDEVLDQVDIPFISALNAEWLEAPPLRHIVAAFAEYEKPAPKQYMTPEAAKDLLGRTGGRIDGVKRAWEP